MTRGLVTGAIALALLGAPAAALASDAVGGGGAAGEANGASAAVRGPGPAGSTFTPIARLSPPSRDQRAEFAPPSRRKLDATGSDLRWGGRQRLRDLHSPTAPHGEGRCLRLQRWAAARWTTCLSLRISGSAGSFESPARGGANICQDEHHRRFSQCRKAKPARVTACKKSAKVTA